MTTIEQAAEELKKKGITPETKHHTYDYVYQSALEVISEQKKRDFEFFRWVEKGNWRRINKSGTKEFFTLPELYAIFEKEIGK